MFVPGVLSKIGEWTVPILGSRVQIWMIFAVVVVALVAGMTASYFVSRPRSSRFGAIHVGGRPVARFPEVIWKPHAGFLWKVTVGYELDQPGGKSATEANGPYCPHCKTGLVIMTVGGILGTDIGSEDYWKCPQCGKKLKATLDEEDLRDEVKKKVQGMIDRGEM